jgi:hypothetical protein
MRLLPMLDSFRDELEKIAMIGAGTALGGLAGYAVSPRSIKGKVMGTLAGGVMGSGIGSALQFAKRQVVDEPAAREHAALYGYTPSATLQQNASPYGPYVW